MQVCDRVAGDGPGQLLLPFGQFTFRVKGAKSPLRVQSSSFSNFISLKNWTGSGAKDFFDTLTPPQAEAGNPEFGGGNRQNAAGEALAKYGNFC